MTSSDSSKMQTVLVTGGSGLVGSHIVQLLLEVEYARWCQERGDRLEHARQRVMLSHGDRARVQEIRVLSLDDFNVSSLDLDFSPDHIGVKVTSLTGNLTSRKDIARAVEGVTEVYHCAATIDTKTRHYVPSEMIAVNVGGTRSLLELAEEAGVERLVYTSTASISVPWGEDIADGTEETVPKLEDLRDFMCGAYAYTKTLAESDVLASNSSALRTLAVRLPTVYGERDKRSLAIALKYSKATPLIGPPTLIDIGYAGNLAWVHLCAMDRLRTDPDLCSGQGFFVKDDHPPIELFEFTNKVGEAAGLGVPPTWRLPIWPLMTIAWLIELVARCSFYFTGRVPSFIFRPNVPSPLEVNLMQRTFYFSDSKARRVLQYEPLYSPKESILRTMKDLGLEYKSDTFGFDEQGTVKD